ncbi:MAG: hypothetical protein CO128_00270 [Ignavibacteriales bacterium CG_4_9_14_3_um_filter_30_11]|nr:MAG: hypothetical protein CO128_00270 [Ignavibacteriales bacterium CG_4_9_14_3_um_filter_30_11]
MEIFSQIPKDLINFLLVVLFSLLIGLEQRRLHIELEFESLFGTDRTITLVGIFGFILYILSPETLTLFFAGGFVLAALLGVYYFNKIKVKNQWGLTSVVIALITYCLTPLVYLQPPWMVMLIFVTILIVVEMKESLFQFSKKFDRNEFTTLAKFIIIAGIVLPLLPYDPISKWINISAYQIWLSIVAVSSISYFSYLLKKFVFPNSGIILSAVLGGLYSSTATTIILAKKSKEENDAVLITSGILAATGMMYIRILILAWIFNINVAMILLPYFMGFIIISAALIALLQIKSKTSNDEALKVNNTQNPLEFKTALVFGLLFGFFAVLTNLVVANYGNMGVNIISLIVGVTDIDPYILNLFQLTDSSFHFNTIVNATIIASASNNLIKMIYTLILGEPKIKRNIVIGFSVLIIASIFSVVI